MNRGEPTPAQQLTSFRESWEKQNGTLKGRATVAPEPPPPVKPPVKPKSLSMKLLEAAKQLGGRFSEEGLTVYAYLGDPMKFGLKSFETQYPDSHKVRSLLCGKRGLVQRGFLQRLAGGLLRLTEKGRKEVEAYPCSTR